MSATPQERQFLQRLLDAAGDGRKLCPRCGCCEMCWEDWWNCGGEGVDGHECGEDSCCCLYPEDNVRCDICGGEGAKEWLKGNTERLDRKASA